MKFVLNRNKNLTSTMGHSIDFKKGVATHVQPEMWSEAQAIGAVPEEELPESKLPMSKEPLDPVARKAEIFEAFELMKLGNKREDFTGTGAPHGKALAEALGFKIDNKERDALWLEFNTRDED